jgi:hypothetical protein
MRAVSAGLWTIAIVLVFIAVREVCRSLIDDSKRLETLASSKRRPLGCHLSGRAKESWSCVKIVSNAAYQRFIAWTISI